MEKAELRSFGTPDEIREFPKGRVELVKIGGATIGRAILAGAGDIGPASRQNKEL